MIRPSSMIPCLLLLLPVICHAGKDKTRHRSYEFPGSFTLVLKIPEAWEEHTVPKTGQSHPRLNFQRPRGSVTFTCDWNQTQISNTTIREIAVKRLKQSGNALLPRAVEDRLDIRRREVKDDVVYYLVLQDRHPAPGGYPFLSLANTTRGNFIVSVTILTHEKTDPLIFQVLDILGESRVNHRERTPSP